MLILALAPKSQTMISNDAPPQRLFFLDWVRIIAFAVLVLYHVGMYYVTWDFHIKSLHASTLLES